MRKMIPFNNPHRFRIEEIRPGFVHISAPYIRSNKNHLGGVHAMCLGTLAELTCGMALLTCLDMKDYRLIMQTIEISYHYQAKMAVEAKLEIPLERLEGDLMRALNEAGVAPFNAEVSVNDSAGNHICTAYVKWQIKDWKHVRTSP